MTKRNRPVEPGSPPVKVEKGPVLRELVELEAELRRHGMHKSAKTVGDAVKLMRSLYTLVAELEVERERLRSATKP